MPDLRGRSLRLAFEEIQALGLTADIKGAGIVASQNPAPGTRVKPGAICQIIGSRQSS
jgi:beta-lactam-binding protein with PASTA domain